MATRRKAERLRFGGPRGLAGAWADMPPVLTPQMAEAFTMGALTVKVLENLRLAGGGPVFRRRGHPTRGRVLYLKADLVAYLENLPAAATTTEERIRAEACAAGA